MRFSSGSTSLPTSAISAGTTGVVSTSEGAIWAGRAVIAGGSAHHALALDLGEQLAFACCCRLLLICCGPAAPSKSRRGK
jgi:hypothetical protein